MPDLRPLCLGVSLCHVVLLTQIRPGLTGSDEPKGRAFVGKAETTWVRKAAQNMARKPLTPQAFGTGRPRRGSAGVEWGGLTTQGGVSRKRLQGSFLNGCVWSTVEAWRRCGVARPGRSALPLHDALFGYERRVEGRRFVTPWRVGDQRARSSFFFACMRTPSS